VKCLSYIEEARCLKVNQRSSAIKDVKSAGSNISIYFYVFVAWRLMEHSDDWSSLVDV